MFAGGLAVEPDGLGADESPGQVGEGVEGGPLRLLAGAGVVLPSEKDLGGVVAHGLAVVDEAPQVAGELPPEDSLDEPRRRGEQIIPREIGGLGLGVDVAGFR